MSGFIPILTDHDLTEEQWNTSIAKEYISELFMRQLMGESADAVIHVSMDLAKEAGDAVTFGIRSQLIGGKVTGSNKLSGNEGRVEFYGRRQTIDMVRHGVKFENVDMQNKRVAWDTLGRGKEALVESARVDLDESIITACTDTSTGRVRGRYLYGAADSNWNATHSTALQNVDNTNDKFTTDMARIAKRKALIPVNATAKIWPMKVKTGEKGAIERWYIMIVHPYAMRDLVDNDTKWQNAQLLLPPNANRDSVLYTGNSFRGAYDGILFYEYDRIPLVASTIQVCHNLFMGAQACTLAWGQLPKFGQETGDFGHDVAYEISEIRGISKVVWDRAVVDSAITNEDNAIVHVFSAGVAD